MGFKTSNGAWGNCLVKASSPSGFSAEPGFVDESLCLPPRYQMEIWEREYTSKNGDLLQEGYRLSPPSCDPRVLEKRSGRRKNQNTDNQKVRMKSDYLPHRQLVTLVSAGMPFSLSITLVPKLSLGSYGIQDTTISAVISGTLDPS
ncbi:MAG: hypothetical protein ACE5IR_21670 [bacterium]